MEKTVGKTEPVHSEMNRPVSSEDVGCCLAFRSPLSSVLMLVSVFPRPWESNGNCLSASQSWWLPESPELSFT